ncbi:hypothetical protein PRIPAC_79695 [Pristionchus pacificus]|uniref:glucuronosyltransferase n=1 Tax=Pristionchus pacificus TaxID=54126 RepID=A0A2A6CJF6_PRIPA|nr:hypothetical protein PRIPAC_79695 [Pristionchus pacificus]|eukprot:PDM78240.1 Glycosyltransferase [Pristionchus pacificus]
MWFFHHRGATPRWQSHRMSVDRNQLAEHMQPGATGRDVRDSLVVSGSMNRLLCLFILASYIDEAVSHKILVYKPRFGQSHSNFLGNIADILAEAGNDVTSLIPIIEPRVRDLTVKSKKIFVQRSERVESIMNDLSRDQPDLFMSNILDPIGVHKVRRKNTLHFVAQCRAVLNETQLIEDLRNEKFHVMIVENFDMCGVALSNLVQPRSLITAAAAYPFGYMLEDFGIPRVYLSPECPFHMEQTEKCLCELANTLLLHSETKSSVSFSPVLPYLHIEDLFREKFGSDFPSLAEISSHAAYTLTNSEPLIDYAAPTLNRVINIPGIAAHQPKPLDNSWNNILAQRSKSILISFGSVAKSVDLPPAIKESIATVIGRFPEITFIWKYEDPEDAFSMEAKSSLSNLHLSSWMPQNDLLNDRRVTAFITHGGMGSTQETALRGIPGIFVPIFGDQPRNAGMMKHNGLGKVLDKFDLPYPDKIEAVIREVLTDKKYTERSRQVGAMLSKKPFKSKELLIKTVEFAAEFGPSSALRPQSYEMNAIEYHNLDICALAFFIFVFLAYAGIQTAKWIVCRVFTTLSIDSKTKME